MLHSASMYEGLRSLPVCSPKFAASRPVCDSVWKVSIVQWRSGGGSVPGLQPCATRQLLLSHKDALHKGDRLSDDQRLSNGL